LVVIHQIIYILVLRLRLYKRKIGLYEPIRLSKLIKAYYGIKVFCISEHLGTNLISMPKYLLALDKRYKIMIFP